MFCSHFAGYNRASFLILDFGLRVYKNRAFRPRLDIEKPPFSFVLLLNSGHGFGRFVGQVYFYDLVLIVRFKRQLG
jgi:hypothetical protein